MLKRESDCCSGCTWVEAAHWARLLQAKRFPFTFLGTWMGSTRSVSNLILNPPLFPGVYNPKLANGHDWLPRPETCWKSLTADGQSGLIEPFAKAGMCEVASNMTVKKYRFGKDQEKGDGDDRPRELVVLIPEVLDPRYGMYVWPCAVVLAQYIWFHRRLLFGKRILEIGAGVSLPGIVAAKCGAEVILSDNADFSECLDNCRRSCQMNNLSGIRVIGLTWGHVSPCLLSLAPVDFILGADVLFEPEDFEDVVSTVHYLTERNTHAQFWTTYQVRSANWSIEGLLYKWEMESTHVPLQSFEATKEQLAGSSLPGMHTIQMMVISRKKK